jgi:anti-sigma B factor antagonist
MSVRKRITASTRAQAPGTHGEDGAAPLQVEAWPGPRGVRVRPLGEIDLATVGGLRSKIDECVAAGWERVVLDLRGVTFMDCTGLHLVLDADAAARAAGWELVVIEGPRAVQRVFELTGLRDSLPFVNGAPPVGTDRLGA